jgi:hypothetical protein
MTTTEILNALNGYTGDDLWNDVVHQLDNYDAEATERFDPTASSDVIALTDGTVLRASAGGVWDVDIRVPREVVLEAKIIVSGAALHASPVAAKRAARAAYEALLRAGLGRIEHEGVVIDLGGLLAGAVVLDGAGDEMDASLSGAFKGIA